MNERTYKPVTATVSAESGNPFRIKVTGSISGNTLTQLESDVMTEFSKITVPEFILDLRDATYIDSRGITLCIRLYKLCVEKKIKLSLETNPIVFRLFSTTNLTNILNIRQIDG
jgi:anti-anti-sigma factor